MKNKRRHAHRSIVTVLTLILTLLFAVPGVAPAAAGEVPPVQEMIRIDQSDTGTTKLTDFTADEQSTILDLLRRAQYQFAWQTSDGEWAYRAPNRANDLSLSLAADGLHAARYSAAGEPLWDFGLSLAAYGGQTFPAFIAEDGLVGSRERVEYHWSPDVVEWYTNSAGGVEHGLTLAAPPVGVDGSTVDLTFALHSSLTPQLDGDGQTLRLKDASGQTALLYDQLAVYDATGRSLPALLSLSLGGEGADRRSVGEGDRLHIIIDTADATYPLTVDPVLHDQAAKLTASDAEEYDQFGYSVAISGDTLVVGANREAGVGAGDRGAAYVFTRNEGSADGWGQVTKISAAPLQDGAYFGWSVAISGDTLVVGAPNEDDVGVGDCVSGDNCGAAYIFERNKNGTDVWGQVDRLTAGLNAEDGGLFGESVSISGDTVVVGANRENSLGVNRGAVYLFERNLGGADMWGLRKRLVASPQQDNANFGYAVAISGDTLVVGAYMEDAGGNDQGAAYVFARNQGAADSWGLVKRLVASDPEDGDTFGTSVAISGDTVVVGADDEDGAGINRGAAYVFERNQGGTADNWGQVAKLTASDAANGDHFGNSVAISGDSVVVGANAGDSVGSNDCGAAYLFERNKNGPDSWGPAAKLNASDAMPGDNFGYAVAISGDTVVAGALGADGGGVNQGAAYLFTGGEGQWQEVAIPRAINAEDNDRYGVSVAISGDTVVIGADQENGAGGSNSKRGAAYIIERNEGGAANDWGQVTKLTPNDPGDDDHFGYSVAISGDTVVVGAFGWDGPGGPKYENQGAAYVFERNKDGGGTTADNWGQVARLTAPDLGINADEQSDYFGYSVAISGDAIVVGARYEDHCYGLCHDEGAAYVFGRNKGGKDNWGQVRKLKASDPEDEDDFGYSVAISGDTIVVGAWREDGAAVDSNRGAAYVFKRNYQFSDPGTPLADSWGEIKKLQALSPENGDYFGVSVAISNDTVVVGAHFEDGFGGDNRGAAYIFERNCGSVADHWGTVRKLQASDAQDQDYFGKSVSISGDTVVVGAYGENGIGLGIDDRGAAYVFERNYRPSNPSLPQAENWGEMVRLRASDAANNDFFGYSVAISDGQIIVGAYGEDGDGTDRGAAYVYRWEPFREPEITVSPGSLAFGNRGVDAGPSASQIVTIVNDGDADLHISSVSLTGANTAEFVIESDSGETTLVPAAMRTVYVSFDPSSEGSKSANLSIVSDDGDEATVNVALSGTGIPGAGGWYLFLPLVVNDD